MCVYTGVLVWHLEQTNRSAYMLNILYYNRQTKQMEKEWFIDSVGFNQTAGKYINGIKGTRRSANVTLSGGPFKPQCATRVLNWLYLVWHGPPARHFECCQGYAS